jgi:peptidoglycan/LPS O-acetylase OafA/YrhL
MNQSAATAHEAFRATQRFGSLDGIRALAILGVVWHHSHTDAGSPLAHRGQLGVDLFFVVSGFLIVTLLLRERDRDGAISLPRFYLRRALRIFPLYYLALAGYFVIAVWRGGELHAAVSTDLPYAATYVSNWVSLDSLLVITWSLAAEEQFYLLWPGIERFAPRAARRILAAALAGCIAVQLLAGPVAAVARWPSFLLQSSFTPILVGVVLAHALHTRTGFRHLRSVLAARAAAPFTLAALLVVAAWPWANMNGAPRVLFALTAFGLVGACVVREDHGLARILRWRPLVHLGMVSYGVYLLHLLPLLALAFARNHLPGLPDGLRFALVLAIAWALAAVSFALFERRLLRLKDRWR